MAKRGRKPKSITEKTVEPIEIQEKQKELPQVAFEEETETELMDDYRLADKNFFRVDEVADYFSVTERTIRLWVEHGHLNAKKMGGIIRIPRNSIIDCGEWLHKFA